MSSARALTARMGENRVRPPGQRGFTLLALPGVPACGPTRRAGQEGGDERRGAARNPNLLPEGRGGEEERKINNNNKKKKAAQHNEPRALFAARGTPPTPRWTPQSPPVVPKGVFGIARRSPPAHSRAKTKPKGSCGSPRQHKPRKYKKKTPKARLSPQTCSSQPCGTRTRPLPKVGSGCARPAALLLSQALFFSFLGFF